MKTEECLKDPVFQLNLLLWMVKEQPKECYRVKPLFRELGYDILYVESPFNFPETTLSTILESGLNISHEPEPDLILWNQKHARALYFEAKRSSFGVGSDNTRQARGHLIATGPAFSEVYTLTKSCLLCYVLPSNDRDDMKGCLDDLARELDTNGLSHGESSVHGLSYRDEKIMYWVDAVFKRYTGFRNNECAVMECVGENTDPCPLLLVFSDEDCPNPRDRDFYRRGMVNQVHSCLLCDLKSLAVGEVFEITADKLLERTTDDVFNYLGRKRQKSLRRLVYENVLSEIAKRWSEKQTGVRMSNGILTIQWHASVEKDSFLDWLEDRNTRFAASKPSEDPQMQLIEDIPQNPSNEESC